MRTPDRRTDDILFADLFTSHGDRTTLAQLMSTTSSSVTQQLDANNEDKSYFHAGKLALYAADMMDAIDGGARGETLWRDLSESRAKWLERGAARARTAPAPELHTLSFLCGKFVNEIVLQGVGRGSSEDVRSAARKLHSALGTFLEGTKRPTPIHAGRSSLLDTQVS